MQLLQRREALSLFMHTTIAIDIIRHFRTLLPPDCFWNLPDGSSFRVFEINLELQQARDSFMKIRFQRHRNPTFEYVFLGFNIIPFHFTHWFYRRRRAIKILKFPKILKIGLLRKNLWDFSYLKACLKEHKIMRCIWKIPLDVWFCEMLHLSPFCDTQQLPWQNKT